MQEILADVCTLVAAQGDSRAVRGCAGLCGAVRGCAGLCGVQGDAEGAEGAEGGRVMLRVAGC